MIRFTTSILIFLATALPAAAGSRSFTCFLDGCLMSQEVAVRRGFAAVTLPASMVPASLRVRPLSGAVISRVQTVPAKADPKAEKAIAALDERREALGDRLKALETREEIFTAAARSQSGKAPRKSKSNPEPVTAIRQGTDFALARLEEVYRSRRAVEKELKSLEVRRAELVKKANIGGIVARIWLSERDGAVIVEYLTGAASWKPVYDFRLDGTTQAGVTLLALLPEHEQDISVAIAEARLTDPEAAAAAPVKAGAGADVVTLSSLSLPVTALMPGSLITPLSFTLTNTSGRGLPAGEGTCFWRGEYLGTVVFPGLVPGEQRELRCGIQAPPEKPAETGR